MKIVAISDTHTYHNSVPLISGDVLCHAGDMTDRGSLQDVINFDNWIEKYPCDHKLVIAGNHDFCFENNSDVVKKSIKNFTYLQDSSYVINGVKFYGTPWQPWFHDWAFNIKSLEDRKNKWDMIPEDTDVLIVHGPPFKHGDLCKSGGNAGCTGLLDRIRELKIKYVITGHIHESYGKYKVDGTDTVVVNASVCTFGYKATNKPIILEI